MDNDRNNMNMDNNETLTMTLRLMGFLNASHYAVFNGKRGQTHSHSWQLQFEVEVPVNGKGLVRFEDLEKLINAVLKPYQRTILNDMEPFDRFQPFTENIAAHFFNLLSDLLADRGSHLTKLVVWENPTKGVEVTQRIPYHLLAGQEPGLQFIPSAAAPPTMLNNPGFPSAAMENKDVLAELAASYDALDNDTVEDELIQVEEIETGPVIVAEDENPRPQIAWWKPVIIIVLVLATAVLVYRPLLFAPSYQFYPWGSDTWGHLYKAKFLADQIAQGNYYPQFSADWYNGNQPFRYWAPLPYYVIAGLYFLTSNLFAAGNYYIVLCAVIGALGWLSWRKRLPLGICILLAVIWLVWPDNVRVALSEGNFPRVLATALLPWLVSNYIDSLKKEHFWGPLLTTIILVHLAILCHAMIGAVYCVALFLFTVFDWIFGGTSLKGAGRGVFALVLGVLTSAWWLLPAMSGGMLAMDSFGAGGVQYVDFLQAFDPRCYLADREVTYLGLSMLPVILFSIITWRKLPRWAKASFIAGLLLTLISFPGYSWLHRLMPLSDILWPLRFRSIAGLMLLAAVSANGNFSSINLPKQRIWPLITIGILLLVIIDSGFAASRLIFVKGLPFDVVNVSKKLQDYTGWRIATLDVSSLGSPPAYLFAEDSGREQVFGWAWQGATTAPNIMLLNTALDYKLYPYVIRQLYYLGATDIMTNSKIVKDPITFDRLLDQYGFRPITGKSSRISYWHGGSGPYLIVPQFSGLVIGKFASMYALQYPSLQIGNSKMIDDYTLNELARYPLLIITGAGWHSRTAAEKLVVAYAKQGGKVVVDLNGLPEDVFSKQPKFLNVYGQQVSLRGAIRATSKEGVQSQWQSLDSSSLPWDTFVPLPLDEDVWVFNYMNNKAALFGYKKVAGVKIGFLGANAVYHAFLTGDQTARQWLGDCLGLGDNFDAPELIPVNSYRIKKDGYSLVYDFAASQKAVIPIARLDGMQAYLEGKRVPLEIYENLVYIQLPAGQHTLELRVEKTPIYRWGGMVSAAAVLILLLSGVTASLFGYRKNSNKPAGKGESA